MVYRQNFYPTPWRLIGQTVAVRVTENELVIHDESFIEAARHPLFPRTATGQRSHCKEHEPPRDAQRRTEQLAQRFAEFGAAGTRFLEGLLAGNRYGKNQAERVLIAGGGLPTFGRRGGAGAGRAVRRLQPGGDRNASLPCGAGPRRRWMPWPTTHRTYLDRLVDGEPIPPRPTSDYQDLLGEDPPRCRIDQPRNADRATPRRTEEPRQRRHRASMVTSRRRCRRWGSGLTPEALDAALSAAEKESLSHLEFLHRLLAGPAETKLQRALERRIRAAKFREQTTLEGFDWEFNAKGVDRRSIEQLATCDFVRRHENVILVGQTAWEESRILQSVGMAACVLGLPRAVRDQRQAAPGIHRGAGRRHLDPDARLSMHTVRSAVDRRIRFRPAGARGEAQASTFYYRLLDARTGRRSTALATNIDFTAWAELPRRPTVSDGVPRPPGRRRRDPEAHRPLLPRPPRPTCTGDRSG